MKSLPLGSKPAAHWLLIAIVAICCCWLCVLQSQADEEQVVKSESKLVKAAEEAFKATQAEYQFMQSSPEDVYQWSRRWMEAEMKDGAGDDAIDRHIARMRELQKKIEALYKTGTRGGSLKNFHAANYYLLDAESLKKP